MQAKLLFGADVNMLLLYQFMKGQSIRQYLDLELSNKGQRINCGSAIVVWVCRASSESCEQ